MFSFCSKACDQNHPRSFVGWALAEGYKKPPASVITRSRNTPPRARSLHDFQGPYLVFLPDLFWKDLLFQTAEAVAFVDHVMHTN